MHGDREIKSHLSGFFYQYQVRQLVNYLQFPRLAFANLQGKGDRRGSGILGYPEIRDR